MSHAGSKPDDPGPLVLGASKRKFLAIVLVGAAIIAGGAWLIHYAASPAYQPYDGSKLGRLLSMLGLQHGAAVDAAMGWVVIVFGGLTLIVGILALIPGATGIALDANGFTIRQLFRLVRVDNWNDVDDFAVLDFPAGFAWKWVGFNSRSAKPNVSARWFGCNSMLPDTYGLTAADLARLMILWRERALSRR
jgi:hypothetical protein